MFKDKLNSYIGKRYRFTPYSILYATVLRSIIIADGRDGGQLQMIKVPNAKHGSYPLQSLTFHLLTCGLCRQYFINLKK